MVYNCELWHYASEYYDPQKAHEYYEAHKKLKGSRSSYVTYLDNKSEKDSTYDSRKRNDNYRKIYNETDKTYQKNQSNNLKDIRSRMTKLRHTIRYMSDDDKKAKSDEILQTIKSLREELNTAKNNIQSQYKYSIKTMYTGH